MDSTQYPGHRRWTACDLPELLPGQKRLAGTTRGPGRANSHLERVPVCPGRRREHPLPGRQVITACTPTRPFHCALNCPIPSHESQELGRTCRGTPQIEAGDQDPHSFPTTSSQLPRPSGHVSRKPGRDRSLARAETRTLERVVRGGVEPPTFRFSGAFKRSRDVARRSPIGHLAALISAQSRLASLSACLRWLPFWLPRSG
jgi:hypothetical protein